MKTLKRAEAFPDFLDFQEQVNSKKSHPPGEWLFLIGFIRIGFFRYFSFPTSTPFAGIKCWITQNGLLGNK